MTENTDDTDDPTTAERAADIVFADATQMAGSGEAMIELVGVVKRYGAFTALQGIDLNVARARWWW